MVPQNGVTDIIKMRHLCFIEKNAVLVERMAGTFLFSKENGQSVTITYSDTGFMPTGVSLSAMPAELEAAR